jgi:glutaredoxin 3
MVVSGKEASSSAPVVVFSRTTDPYSVKAKRLLTSLGYKFKSIDLDERTDGKVLEEEIKTLTGLSNTPFIFIGGECVGDNKDLQLLHKLNKLSPMLRDAGAKEHGKL